MPKTHWSVDASSAGQRLDKFLAAPSRLGSRQRATSSLDRGRVYVNGAEVGIRDAGTKVSLGDVIGFWPDRPGSARRPHRSEPEDNLEIVYEDDALIVVNKPAGLLTVPLERKGSVPSVYGLIVNRFRPHGKRKPFVVHRIDQDSSGLVVFAKDADTQRSLQEQFKRREPDRIYHAVVHGRVEPSEGTWRNHLVWNTKALIQKETQAGDPRGIESISDYRVVERFEHASLLEVRLRTGRRNQIRIQAQLRGHPLIGERRYTGDIDGDTIKFGRQALHAIRLSFAHPVDGRRLNFEGPLPADLVGLLTRLRRPQRRRSG